MDKGEFMAELSAQLSRIDANERAEAIAFYNEYFEEAGIENEQSVIEELGSPAKVAAQIKADAAVKETLDGNLSVKNGLYTIGALILGICALPIALPMVIVVVALIFALLVTVGALAFAFVMVVGAFLLTGVLMMAAGIGVFLTDVAVGIFYIGSGLAITGGSILLIVFSIIVLRALVIGSVKLINYIRVKIQKKYASKLKGAESYE
jgi:Predicted membrane protein